MELDASVLFCLVATVFRFAKVRAFTIEMQGDSFAFSVGEGESRYNPGTSDSSHPAASIPQLILP
jgi:hypothetical protein